MSKKREDNSLKIAIIIILVAVYGAISAVQIGIGASDSLRSCNSSFKRGEYLFPAYRLGCWLGESSEDDNKQQNEEKARSFARKVCFKVLEQEITNENIKNFEELHMETEWDYCNKVMDNYTYF